MQEDGYRRKFIDQLRSNPSFAVSELGWTQTDPEYHVQRYYNRAERWLQVEIFRCITL